MPDQTTCILVLGTPRSGTSCVAGIVHLLGVPMAPPIVLPDGVRDRFGGANDANPKGFYTDTEFEALARWVYGSYFPEAPVNLTAEQDEFLQDLVAGRKAHSPAWGLKEWRVAIFLPRFLELAGGEVRIIRTARDPQRSAESWNAHFSAGQTVTAADMVRTKALIDAAVAASGCPVLDLAFDDIIDRPQAAVQSIAQFVRRPVNAAAQAMIDESLRRF